MKVKNTAWRLLVQVILLFAALLAAAVVLVKGWYVFLPLLLPVIVFQVIALYRFQQKAYDELDQFVASVHYRDFSRHFDVKHAPPGLQPLRKGFNEINSAFRMVSRERETQFHYLQKILELVDTGILSYEEQSGEVAWMNESLKRMLQVPYLKTIHSLAKRDEALYRDLLALAPGEGKIAKIHPGKAAFKIVLSATSFQTDGKKYKLIAFQNVNEALDETESKAWQKLLSVMTHEIMNSVAPISSLADTLKNRLQQRAPDGKNDNVTAEDLELGIDTIRRRSEGLLKFAETYRSLNKITIHSLEKVYVRDLFENLHRLMQPTLQQKNIELEIVLKDTELMLEADTNLVEQVLLNLVVNAIEAVKEIPQPRIVLSAWTAGSKTVVSVADNGSGIAAAFMDKIFVPFFSTKKQGSGIGLSLCKQVMMLHRGNIQVQSAEGEGTAFLLYF